MTVTEFNEICKTFVQVAGLKGHVLVANEKHATLKLKDKAGMWLVAVMPSTEFSGEPNCEVPGFTTLLFVLEAANFGQSDTNELKQFQDTETAIMKIKEHITESQSDGCSVFKNFEANQTVINPEHHIFNDRNGWSMTLVM